MARLSGDASARRIPPRLPSEQELAVQRNYEARTKAAVPKRTGSTRPMDITKEDLYDVVPLMNTDVYTSPLAGLGGMNKSVARQAREFSDDDGPWDEFYDYDQSGYGYTNRAKKKYDATTTADQARKMRLGDMDRDPAPITIPSTATSNPDRPRTVAAGYDPDRKVLTIVFRDGTFYNYYQVGEAEWESFKLAPSKGGPYGPIDRFLNGKPRGTARMAGSTLAGRQGVYRIARTGQWISEGKIQFDRTLAPRTNPTKSRKRKK
jgi:hypothetical protein